MQDMEFTIENGKVCCCKMRDGKAHAQAEVKIAADMVDDRLTITKRGCLARQTRPGWTFFLHQQLDSVA